MIGGTASMALLAGTPRAAYARDDCGRVIVTTELSPAWTDAVRNLTDQLATLPPTECRPATLSVESSGGEVRLVAITDDGRRAERRVSRPSMLVPIALGLVVFVPPDDDKAPAFVQPLSDSPSAPSPPSAPAPAEAAPIPSIPPPQAIEGATSLRTVSVWLGAAVGPRFGVPSSISMLDVEARADLRVDRLLLFVAFRDVPLGFVASQGLDDGDAYRESSVAFGVGRSIPVGRYLLDVSIAPSLVTMRLSIDTPVHARADDVELRVGASARLNVPLSPYWRLTLAADTDVIPDFLKSEDRIDPLPAFPSWTSGVRVGVSGALL